MAKLAAARKLSTNTKNCRLSLLTNCRHTTIYSRLKIASSVSYRFVIRRFRWKATLIWFVIWATHWRLLTGKVLRHTLTKIPKIGHIWFNPGSTCSWLNSNTRSLSAALFSRRSRKLSTATACLKSKIMCLIATVLRKLTIWLDVWLRQSAIMLIIQTQRTSRTHATWWTARSRCTL